MVVDKIAVNPVFRLDVDGKLFKNKESNTDVRETITFNSLFSRLAIVKGDLAMFPNLGLKQHLQKISFNTLNDIENIIVEFEEDVSAQMSQGCTIEVVSADPVNRNCILSFQLENLKVPIQMEYREMNNSIKIINYQFVD